MSSTQDLDDNFDRLCDDIEQYDGNIREDPLGAYPVDFIAAAREYLTDTHPYRAAAIAKASRREIILLIDYDFDGGWSMFCREIIN